jgi:carboxylesterase
MDTKETRSFARRRKILIPIIIFIVLGTLVFLLVFLTTQPFQINNVPSPNPAISYEDAIQRLEEISKEEQERSDLMPICYTKLMTHGAKTEKVIVLYHGFTSCPAMYAELGQMFYDLGYNVLIPLQPHHGEIDRLNPSLDKLTAEELVAFAMQTTDIAQGLGEKVIISGFSGGGTITTWLAQVRDDIDIAMPVSPFLGISVIPVSLNRPVAHLMDNIPNIMQWWDPITKEDNPYTDEFQYPRFGTHALAEYLRLGYVAENLAKNHPPSDKIIMVSNGAEPSVNNRVIDQFIKIWQSQEEYDGQIVESFRFNKKLHLPHDIITPSRFEGNRTIVYPKLIELLENQ